MTFFFKIFFTPFFKFFHRSSHIVKIREENGITYLFSNEIVSRSTSFHLLLTLWLLVLIKSFLYKSISIFFSYNQRSLPGSISPALECSSKLFAFTADGHLMLSCGYWDNSIRLVNTDRGKDKLKACISFHNGMFSCDWLFWNILFFCVNVSFSTPFLFYIIFYIIRELHKSALSLFVILMISTKSTKNK